MTNDKLSTQMVEALAIADAERRTEDTKRALDARLPAVDEETTFIQEETTEDRNTLQV